MSTKQPITREESSGGWWGEQARARSPFCSAAAVDDAGRGRRNSPPRQCLFQERCPHRSVTIALQWDSLYHHRQAARPKGTHRHIHEGIGIERM